jgi:hypothetical protein
LTPPPPENFAVYDTIWKKMVQSYVQHMKILYGTCALHAIDTHPEYEIVTVFVRGWDSSVGIATRYELGGPEIESWRRRDFLHQSRPVLGPTQPPIQWVPGGKAAWLWR